MTSIEPSPARAWAEVNTSHLLHNLEVARKTTGSKVMAVLKAGAYGHGLEEVATSLAAADISFIGVASVVEARRLTAAGINRPFYLLGPTFPEERAEVVANRWTASISSVAEAEHFNALNEGNEPLAVHLTVDTGMGRGGFLPDQVEAIFPELLELEYIHFEGIGSHLPSADEDREFTERQFDQFDNLVTSLSRLHHFDYVHLANSAGALAYTSRTTNLVRPGLMLYGVSPLAQYQELLKPVMTLKSRISLIRDLPAGQGISYGRSHILTKSTKVATVGIGYGDGYSRHFSETDAEVLILGKRCPVLGRVTMDQIMVDVSDIEDCQAGDEVELFGENMLISELASKSSMIAWEILTGITPRVLRIYV